MSEEGRPRRKKVRAIAGVFALGVVIVGVVEIRPLYSLYKIGYFDTLGTRSYNGGTVTDLKAIRTALMLTHDSDGQFPKGDHWMEDIQQHLRTDDMSGNEAAKKLVDPAFLGQPNKYGFALNDFVAGKYKGDIKDPKTPLVFESQDPGRDAHGDPAKLAPKPPRPGGNLAIALDGTILKLPN